MSANGPWRPSRRNVFQAGAGIAVGAVAVGIPVAANWPGAPESGPGPASGAPAVGSDGPAELIVTNAKVTTLEAALPSASTVAVRGGRIVAVGGPEVTRRYGDSATQVIDGEQRRLVPGLNDVHMHLVSYGATFNREVRWDGITSLARGLEMVGEQAGRTPAGQWVRVLGGWSPYQFAEQRLPTPAELDRVAPSTPVMVTHLWDRVLLNREGLRALHIDRTTPDPEGGRIERDPGGNPTGVIVAVDDWSVILNAMGELPSPADLAERKSSTQQFMRVLNSYGITSVQDAGAGAYPDSYQAVRALHAENALTLRIAGTLYPPMNASEPETFSRWLDTVDISSADEFFRIYGAGEILSYDSFDMTNFAQNRPGLAGLENGLDPILRAVVSRGWPFRLHAAYDETISRLLDVIERVARSTPFRRRWSIEHAETLSERNMDRIKKLGGGVSVQSRLLFQTEEFLHSYGSTEAMRKVVPVTTMLERGLPVGFGTDSMRIASYNPWLTPYFFVSGRSLNGTEFLPPEKRLSRVDALRLSTAGSAWFAQEEHLKGTIGIGKMADFALLSDDYFTVPDAAIGELRSVLTVVDGRVVHGSDNYHSLAPAPFPVLPSWSPYLRT